MIQPSLRGPVVHTPNFAPDPKPSGLLRPPGDYYLYVGRLEFYKGIPELAKAAMMSRGRNRFVVVGKGKQAGVLEAARRQSAPLDLHGWLPAGGREATYAPPRAPPPPPPSVGKAPRAALQP